jgi:hypothetical protein
VKTFLFGTENPAFSGAEPPFSGDPSTAYQWNFATNTSPWVGLFCSTGMGVIIWLAKYIQARIEEKELKLAR